MKPTSEIKKRYHSDLKQESTSNKRGKATNEKKVKKEDSDDEVHEEIFKDNARELENIIVISSDSEETDDYCEDSDSESDSSEKKQSVEPADSDEYYNDPVSDSDACYDDMSTPEEPTFEECHKGSGDEVDSDDNCGD